MAFHIIGDQDTVLGYRFAGVTGSVVATPAEAQQAFRETLADERQRILLLTERVERMLVAEVTAHRLEATPPYIVVIEDLWGADGKRRSLQELIFEAVGIRIVRGD
jgi:vacuolar-type H+-ATPase subunit F/Vma7